MRRTGTARIAALLLVLVLALAGVVAVAGGPAGATTSGGGSSAERGGTTVPGTTTGDGQDAGAGTGADAGGAAVPAPSPTVSPAQPAPTSSPVPTPTPTQQVPVPVPTTEPEPVPTPTPTPEPEQTGTPSPAPTPTPTDAGVGGSQQFSRPPAVTTSSTPWAQLLTALVVVVAGAVAVVAISARRARLAAQGADGGAAGATPVPSGAAAADGDGTPFSDDGPDDDTAELRPPPTSAEVLRLMVVAGEAMVDAGHTVSSVADTLDELAAVHGVPGTETVVLPTALLVSVPDGDGVATAAVSTGRRPLMLHQVDELTDVLREASAPDADVAGVTARITLLRTTAPPFGMLARLGGYLLLSVGLAALLGGSWVDLLVAAGLGLAVGAVQLVVGRMPSGVEVLVTVASAFVVAAAVLLAARVVPDLGVLPSLIAPLVLFLPGGLLTTGVIELATGQMLSGAGRIAAGAMQLVMLAGGIVAAAALVGVPAVDLASGGHPLGPLAPWIGVAVFGAGTVIYRCGRPRTIGWVILVLAVAYGAQVLGDALLGGALSAFVGALAMTPVALAVARFPSGPSPLVSFLPAFWLLVPGALGLVGVTSLLDGDSNGVSTLVTTGGTMVAIALGVLVGLSAARGLPGRQARWSLGGVPGLMPAARPWPRRGRTDPPV
ncbi:threonine/serine exporter ThrE family protein [Cellulomonas sp. PS-H5]|uniref:threonine/serine ThrE exporter family protein n=1 Tax=Cellulomonas sp. PS-H5 TaxID=2820400 RepID=UPI001C4EEB29|nr:threonine/serine exporter family protein [Cellulomonas sp. PS-H5]MBW0254959.1 threonine/serine exporter family protein [Cellulomonas sp. PS-H5]